MLLLGEAIRDADPKANVLAVIPPSFATRLVSWLEPGSLRRLLVAVDTAPWGIREGLSRLRRLAATGPRTRIGIFLVGVDAPRADLAALRQLERAAARQLGIPVEELGAVVRDQASYRALLLEVPVIEVDPNSPSSRSLNRLARRVLEADRPQALTSG
jgi:hypothetical protein